ncbi:MAG TPA: polyribonucleotide nucleotidyltransferase [Tepidisphaeraceae bacterium]|jgi:polyribonucleotide nucleotidyltransferase
MQAISVSREIGGRTLTISTGSYAKLSHGSVTVQYGETIVFGAVVRAKPREGIDFFPLQVDYRERRAAAGKFPGGFMKREGRPTTREVLISRLIDRPLRPLFPYGFMDEVQIQLNTLAFDQENDPDILAGIAASACVAISDIPLTLPTAHAKVGRVDGKLILNPTIEEVDTGDMEVVVAGTKNFVNMIEVGSYEVPEDTVADAIKLAHDGVVEVCHLIDELVAKVGKAKVGEIKGPEQSLLDTIKSKAGAKIREIKGQVGKQGRNEKLKQLRFEIANEIAPAPAADVPFAAIAAQKATVTKIYQAFSVVEETITREAILDGVRPDGRSFEDIRPITCEVGVLPRVHGSAVFTRGETQAMCTITLGTSRDEQAVDGLVDEYSQKFMLHYNFPSFSVGEVRPIRGPGRREIGHGALAERSLLAVLPTVDEFPYTVRVISDILESNGSSSMASSCGGCLALMDAGVPIRAMVAGISVGLVKEGDNYKLLTDIIGEEDHFGDMDFKVCGTRDGITAIQLDIKIEGIPHDIIRETLHRARDARFKILDEMAKVLPEPRKDISEWAPRLFTVKIDPEKIGKLIGPGGKNIKALQADTGCNIDIDDDGTVYISSTDSVGAQKCRDIVEAMTQSVQVGKIYTGRVVSIKDFGAFVEIAPETDGLCHVSELSDQYVGRVDDVVKLDDEIQVKVLLVDDQGRIKLSRKAAMEELGLKDPERARPERPQRDDRGGDRGGDRAPRPEGGDRGPRRDGGDRGPRRDGGGDRGPRRDDRGPAPEADRGNEAPRRPARGPAPTPDSHQDE